MPWRGAWAIARCGPRTRRLHRQPCRAWLRHRGLARILGESVAGIEQIDMVLKKAAGFRMGPFELLDLTGLDVSHPVMESIYHQFYQEPQPPVAADRFAPGRRPVGA